MDKIIDEILSIISDYQCDNEPPLKITVDDILAWANQFDEGDSEFILQELCHILKNGVYVSKAKAQKLLIEGIVALSKKHNYANVQDFLKETVFLSIQPKGKSQNVLLEMLDDELNYHFGISINQCGTFGQKNYVYIDDIIASGKTVLRDCKTWFSENDNLNNCKHKKTTFSVLTFCKHKWAVDRIRWSLKLHFNSDYFTNEINFRVLSFYTIDDNAKDNSPKLNFAYPTKSNPDWDMYLASLDEATTYEERAYRLASRPKEELFFSSGENRNRFEQILMNKGIEIISQIKDESKKINHRPLGKTYPHYRTFGTGTLFFTWRNISNTCPIVFWWDNPAHNWKGLFPLNNRGN